MSAILLYINIVSLSNSEEVWVIHIQTPRGDAIYYRYYLTVSNEINISRKKTRIIIINIKIQAMPTIFTLYQWVVVYFNVAKECLFSCGGTIIILVNRPTYNNRRVLSVCMDHGISSALDYSTGIRNLRRLKRVHERTEQQIEHDMYCVDRIIRMFHIIYCLPQRLLREKI